MGRCTYKSSILKGANILSLQKNSLKPTNAASHNNTSWYTDTDGVLEHSPSGGSLYYRGLPSHPGASESGGCMDTSSDLSLRGLFVSMHLRHSKIIKWKKVNNYESIFNIHSIFQEMVNDES